jgi:hypothetical protein
VTTPIQSFYDLMLPRQMLLAERNMLLCQRQTVFEEGPIHKRIVAGHRANAKN